MTYFFLKWEAYFKYSDVYLHWKKKWKAICFCLFCLVANWDQHIYCTRPVIFDHITPPILRNIMYISGIVNIWLWSLSVSNRVTQAIRVPPVPCAFLTEQMSEVTLTTLSSLGLHVVSCTFISYIIWIQNMTIKLNLMLNSSQTWFYTFGELVSL